MKVEYFKRCIYSIRIGLDLLMINENYIYDDVLMTLNTSTATIIVTHKITENCGINNSEGYHLF